QDPSSSGGLLGAPGGVPRPLPPGPTASNAAAESTVGPESGSGTPRFRRESALGMLAPLGGVCAPRDWSNWMETSNSSPEAERRAPGAPSLHPRSARTLLALAGAALTFATTLPARATGTDAASTDGKGIAAGILLGAETVVLAEAALGVRPGWAYRVGCGAGSVGGGYVGYLFEDHVRLKAAMVLLACGLVRAIPAQIDALSACAYERPRDYVQDSAPGDDAVDAVPQGASAPRRPSLS